MLEIFRGLLGLSFIILLAFIFSTDKKSINWRLVATGIVLQIIFGILVTQVDFVAQVFRQIASAFVIFLDFARYGAEFVFGDLAKNSFADSSASHNMGFIFAFQVLPTIIFFATVSAGLYYLGILQKLVFAFAWVMSKTMRLSGAESLSAAGNIFLGQSEAPILVKPYISKMTDSELLCLMTGGMATIAGSVFAAYVSFLGGDSEEMKVFFGAQLLSASIMSAPAAIVISKIMIPQKKGLEVDSTLNVSKEKIGGNLIDALSIGASDGLRLALNVAGMLLAFIAVIYMFNFLLKDVIGDFLNINTKIQSATNGAFDGLSLQYILGQIFRVLAFMMGVNWNETLIVGSLLGQKTVINEFIAFSDLSVYKNQGLLSQKSIIISTFALCGFSNFSSIAIQVGGIGTLAPDRQTDLSRLGLKSLYAGTLACLMTGTIAGALYVVY